MFYSTFRTSIIRLIFSLIFILCFSKFTFSDIYYPEYTGNPVIDNSNKFDKEYLTALENDLKQYSFEMRIVFIDSKDQINLGIYAPKLFGLWKMSDESILVVIDPYLNKTGYGLGKKVLESMRKRKTEVQTKNKEDRNDDITSNIDYNNLAQAIAGKFSPEQTAIVPDKGNKDSNANEGTTGNSYLSLRNRNTGDSSKVNKRYPNANFSIFNFRLLKIILVILAVAIIGGVVFFFFNKRQNLKKQIELKTNYSFDGEIQLQELYDTLDKITSDIDKMSKYRGQTIIELKEHIDKLKDTEREGNEFAEKFKKSLENIEIDNLEATQELIEECKELSFKINGIHKESVSIRKEFKQLIEKSQMSLSDIRVNIVNCKNILEENRTLYKLELNYSEEQINNCEKCLIDAQNALHINDLVEYRNIVQKIHESIKDLKSNFDVIPHLYRQLQENIPLNIESSLEESNLENNMKNSYRNELNHLKNNALSSLANGRLGESEKMINIIFEKLNEIK